MAAVLTSQIVARLFGTVLARPAGITNTDETFCRERALLTTAVFAEIWVTWVVTASTYRLNANTTAAFVSFCFICPIITAGSIFARNWKSPRINTATLIRLVTWS